MNIWKFQRAISRRLLKWGIFSVVSGFAMLKPGGFWRGVGVQFISWGVIDALIAVFGQLGSQQRLKKLDDPDNPVVVEQETQNLRNLLWFNAGLDVLYILGGWIWVRRGEKKQSPFVSGNGWGVIAQAIFLLIFDAVQAMMLAPKHTQAEDR